MAYRSKNDQDDPATNTRVCRVCLERKSMSDFHQLVSKIHRSRTCKSCCHKRQKANRRSRDPEELRRADMDGRLRRVYRITLGEYESAIHRQDGRCAICKLPFAETWGNVHVDHCHDTGLVRGLLCFGCNTGLGKFGDSAETMASAIRYLDGGFKLNQLDVTELKALSDERRSGATKHQHNSGRTSHPVGEENTASKVTEREVVEMREKYATDMVTQHELSREYGISQAGVSRILLRKSWKHI